MKLKKGDCIVVREKKHNLLKGGNVHFSLKRLFGKLKLDIRFYSGGHPSKGGISIYRRDFEGLPQKLRILARWIENRLP